MPKVVSQKRFLRGINAAFGRFSEPQGILTRISNLILGTRGALKTCDGSKIIAQPVGGVGAGLGPWLDVFLFQPVGVNAYYLGLLSDYNTQLVSPPGLACGDGGAGGTFNPGQTYYYKVTALDGTNLSILNPASVPISGSGVPLAGESAPSNEASFTQGGASHKITLTWGFVTGAVGFAVYRGTAPGNELLVLIILWAQNANQVVTWTDDNSLGAAFFSPPSVNNTRSTILHHLTGLAYGVATKVGQFTAASIPILVGPSGSFGGGGENTGTGISSGQAPTPMGGFPNSVGPLPQLVQFIGKVFMALGNGKLPQIFTDPGTVSPLTNTFSAQYPQYQNAVTFLQGDLIQFNIGGTNYLFQATQGGTTAAAGTPAFSATLNSTVADNNIIWTNIGQVSSSPAPRGAAHAIVYAGSLWVLDTSPQTTGDGIDGPNCIRMSDLNNPTSWNPLNVAFLGRDDGSELTGAQPFTIAELGIAPTGSLVVFKYFRTYQIIGVFGSTSFSIQEAQTDLGNVAPRSIQFLPGFGIMRLSHLGFALFSGVRDKLVSEDIRPYLFSDPMTPDILPIDWSLAYFVKASQSAKPPMYIAACPIALPLLAGVNINTVAVASTFLNVMYWVLITKFQVVNGVAQETQVSGMISAGRMDNAHSIQVSAPSDSTATKYRVYIGTTPNAPNKYVEFNDLSNPVTISAPPATLGVPSMLGGLTRLFCYDLILKAWTIFDLPWPISVIKQSRAPGTIPITITASFQDGTIRRIQAGDGDWDGVGINWMFRAPEIYGEGGSQSIFLRGLTIRGVGTPSVANSISVTINANGNDVTGLALPKITILGTNQFELYLFINVPLVENAHATVTGQGMVQIDSCDWDTEPGDTGVNLVIS